MFVEFSYFETLLFLLISFSIYFGFSWFIKSYYKDWLKGLCLNIVIFCFGIGLHVSQKDILKPNHFSKYKSQYLIIRLKEPLLERKKSFKGLAK
jgi:hypothetical protein